MQERWRNQQQSQDESLELTRLEAAIGENLQGFGYALARFVNRQRPVGQIKS